MHLKIRVVVIALCVLISTELYGVPSQGLMSVEAGLPRLNSRSNMHTSFVRAGVAKLQKDLKMTNSEFTSINLEEEEEEQEEEEEEEEEEADTKRTKVMATLRGQLDKILDGKNLFCCGGKAIMPCPELVIDGIGQISNDLTAENLSKIRSLASQAGYGLGTQTLVDLDVRNTLQIEPSKLSITNNRWHSALEKVIRHVADTWTIPYEQIEAKCYKLLLYEKDGHFKQHKDTEKYPGMFGTLSLQFPCNFEGGKLVVRHSNQTESFDFSTTGKRQQRWPLNNNLDCSDGKIKQNFHFLAHYADCDHEIEKITSGYRLTMIYSLCWKDDCPPKLRTVKIADDVVKTLRTYEGCLGYILEHQYSEVSLARHGAKALKGNDKKLCEFLVAANSTSSNLRLKVYIVKASRITQDFGDDVDYGEPAMDNFEDTVFALDGSAPTKRATKKLTKLQIYDDIINRAMCNEGEGYFWHEETANDRFWKDKLGQTPYFVGNEGKGPKQFYSCYILAFWRETHACEASK